MDAAGTLLAAVSVTPSAVCSRDVAPDLSALGPTDLCKFSK